MTLDQIVDRYVNIADFDPARDAIRKLIASAVKAEREACALACLSVGRVPEASKECAAKIRVRE